MADFEEKKLKKELFNCERRKRFFILGGVFALPRAAFASPRASAEAKKQQEKQHFKADRLGVDVGPYFTSPGVFSAKQLKGKKSEGQQRKVQEPAVPGVDAINILSAS